MTVTTAALKKANDYGHVPMYEKDKIGSQTSDTSAHVVYPQNVSNLNKKALAFTPAPPTSQMDAERPTDAADRYREARKESIFKRREGEHEGKDGPVEDETVEDVSDEDGVDE